MSSTPTSPSRGDLAYLLSFAYDRCRLDYRALENLHTDGLVTVIQHDSPVILDEWITTQQGREVVSAMLAAGYEAIQRSAGSTGCVLNDPQSAALMRRPDQEPR